MSTNLYFCSVMAVSALMACGSSFAQETVVFEDNFDSYVDQTDFQNAWPAPTATGSLTNTRFLSTPNSVTFGTAAQRNDHSITGTGFPASFNIIRFSIDF